MKGRRQILAEAGLVLGRDIRMALRDPLALILMFVIPLFIYPLGMRAMANAQHRQAVTIDAEVLAVSAPAAFETWLLPDDHLRVDTAPFDPEDIEHGPAAALTLPEHGKGAVLRYSGASRQSSTARDRVNTVLARRQGQDEASAFAAEGLPITPDQVVKLDTRDVATAMERSGDLVGRWLPLFLVFLVVSGGAYTALDAVTGERERGTLETMLTSAVDRRSVILAKYALVLLFTSVSGLISLCSIGMVVGLGLVELPGGMVALSGLGPAGLLEVAVLLLPLFVGVAAVLLTAAAYAPDFRSGQAMSLPTLLVLCAPAAVAAFPQVSFTPVLALIPITNVALALRATLGGAPPIGLVVLAWVMSAIYAGLALLGARHLLERESVITGPSGRGLRALQGRRWPEAMGLFAIVWLLFWFFGQMAQKASLIPGFLFTQLGLFVLPAVAAIAWAGLPVRETLGLRRPRPRDLLLAVVAGVCAPGVGILIERLQSLVFTVPSSVLLQFEDALLGDRPLWQVLLLFAVLPGLCEEILFRGAILGLLQGSMRPVARVVLVGVLFGFLHLDAFRIVPVSIIGMLFGAAVLRGRSLFLSMTMHAINNTLLLAASSLGWFSEQELGAGGLLAAAGLGAISVAAVAAMGREP